MCESEMRSDFTSAIVALTILWFSTLRMHGHVPILSYELTCRPGTALTSYSASPLGMCLSQAHGISPSENVVKECAEEAGIPADLAAAARCGAPQGHQGFRA